MSFQIIQGDALTVLRTMEDASVNCCITSPPFYGLRNYGVEGQIGLEKTPALYIQQLVGVFREVKRVLCENATVWLNLGDSYASGKGTCYNPGGNTSSLNVHLKAANVHPLDRGNKSTLAAQGLKPKDLIGIPWATAFALRDEGWHLRSDIIWAKPAPMPESVTDRPTRSHEYIFLLAKAERYYYDFEAVKELAIANHGSGNGYRRDARLTFDGRGSDEPWQPRKSRDSFKREASRRAEVPGQTLREHRPNRAESSWDVQSRNLRDVWTVNTEPFPEAHFATFPPKLIEPCVLAGCPAGGTILDPFCGAGTTGLVAKKHGRNFIGIELNPAYIAMAERRCSQEVFDWQGADSQSASAERTE